LHNYSQNSQSVKLLRLLYTQGWMGGLDSVNLNVAFISGRTNLWFERYFAASSTLSLNGSLFCMGAAHLHSHFEGNDTQNPVTGFLGKLENASWTLENLDLSGHWIPWSVQSHRQWLEGQKLKAKPILKALFPKIMLDF
jgi:hypothetical protein